MKNFVFQAYSIENIKLVTSERRSSNFVPEMALFPNIYIIFFFFSFDLRKMTDHFVQTNFNEMNKLSELFSSSKITTYGGQFLL